MRRRSSRSLTPTALKPACRALSCATVMPSAALGAWAALSAARAAAMPLLESMTLASMTSWTTDRAVAVASSKTSSGGTSISSASTMSASTRSSSRTGSSTGGAGAGSSGSATTPATFGGFLRRAVVIGVTVASPSDWSASSASTSDISPPITSAKMSRHSSLVARAASICRGILEYWAFPPTPIFLASSMVKVTVVVSS